jgi:hypothetical protein
MLHLLLGTRTREVKCSLKKTSKEWYYDPNVWKVVLEFGIGVRLPYKMRECTRLSFRHIVSTPDGLVVCGNLGTAIYNLLPGYTCARRTSLSEITTFHNVTWTGTGSGNLLCVLKDNRVLCNIKPDGKCVEMYINGIVDKVYYLTSVGNIVAWVRDSMLFVLVKSTSTVRAIADMNGDIDLRDKSHLVAITRREVIYIVMSGGAVGVYDRTGLAGTITLKDPIPTRSDTIVRPTYVIIHDNILHTCGDDMYLRAYTLSGELISRHYLNAFGTANGVPLFKSITSMCVHDGKLLVSDGIRLAVF